MRSEELPRRISTGLVCLLFAVLVYRAKTQSFTIDEAYAFNLYVDQKIDQFLLHYDACNHVLHTLLTKFVRYWLGTSELVLRLVSLLGGALYFVVILRLSRLAAGDGWLHVAAVAALSLNPLLLDMLVASRGYGLAVALLMWSIYYSVRWLNEGRESTPLLRRAGICAGLAIAANLTVLVPAAALGATLLFLALRRGASGIWAVIDRYGGPAVVVAFLFVVLPLSRSAPDNFYVGTKTLADSVSSIWGASLTYIVAAIFAAIAIAGFWTLIKRFRAEQPDLGSDLLALVAVPLALSVATLVFLNRVFLVPYPYGRTGLYFIPLLLLALATMWLSKPLESRDRKGAESRAAHASKRIFSYVATGLLSIAAVSFALQLHTGYFPEWRFDASTNRVMSRIAEDNREHGGKSFTVGASWVYEQSLKYYRKRNRLHHMSADIIMNENLSKLPADYYVLSYGEHSLVKKLNLQILMNDESTGTVLARRS